MEKRLDGHIPEPGSERDTKFKEGLNNMHSLVREIVQRRTKNPPKPHERAFIDVMLENPEMFPEPKLLADAITYMIGGFHTSGYLMAWALYFLTQNQDVQERLYQEVMAVVGPKESIRPEDIGNFVYLKQVMSESLRLSISAPWAARFQDVDVYLGGHFVPKGTPVITALGVSLQDEKLWPNPEKFDPDRFSPENVKGRHRQAFLPFGLPGRICPGYRFAFYELTVFLAILIRSFKWTLVEGQVVQSVHGLVTQPRDEIWVQVEPRQFDPDRFSPENVKGRHRQAFIPFGLPGRIYPGYRFAFYELTVFLAILIRSFKWTLVEGQVVQSVHGLVTQPRDEIEIWVQVEPRQ